MNRYISVLLISVMAFSPALISAAELAPKGFTFQKDLKKGDSNIDVTYLQRILNSSEDTLVSKTGLGSSGNETTYFGELTKKAVINFQNKYKDEVLLPAGLSSGSGFVGLYTRTKLNNLLLINNSTSTPGIIAPEQNIDESDNLTKENNQQETEGDGGDSSGLIVGGVVAGGLIGGAALLGGATAVAAESTAVAKEVIHDYFGGMILFTTACTCNFPIGSSLITITDYSLGKTPQSFMYRPLISTLRPNFNIFTPTVYVIGGHDRIPSACMVFAGSTCVPFGYSNGNIDFIRGVGTSALP